MTSSRRTTGRSHHDRWQLAVDPLALGTHPHPHPAQRAQAVNAIVQYYPGADGQWYVRVVSANGRIVLDSEGYSRKWNAKRAAKRAASIFGLKVKEVGRG